MRTRKRGAWMYIWKFYLECQLETYTGPHTPGNVALLSPRPRNLPDLRDLFADRAGPNARAARGNRLTSTPVSPETRGRPHMRPSADERGRHQAQARPRHPWFSAWAENSQGYAWMQARHRRACETTATSQAAKENRLEQRNGNGSSPPTFHGRARTRVQCDLMGARAGEAFRGVSRNGR